jgi:hypothetical protein
VTCLVSMEKKNFFFSLSLSGNLITSLLFIYIPLCSKPRRKMGNKLNKTPKTHTHTLLWIREVTQLEWWTRKNQRDERKKKMTWL